MEIKRGPYLTEFIPFPIVKQFALESNKQPFNIWMQTSIYREGDRERERGEDGEREREKEGEKERKRDGEIERKRERETDRGRKR